MLCHSGRFCDPDTFSTGGRTSADVQDGERVRVTALAELRAGEFGNCCILLLEKLMEEELRRGGHYGYSGSKDELSDYVNGFYAKKAGAVTVTLMAQATDDASVGKYLRRSVRNWLIEESRRHGSGPLARRVGELLSGSDEFDKVPVRTEGAGRWRLAGTSGPPWGGAVSELVSAAHTVREVRTPSWTSDTRRAPIADRDDLLAVLRAVLERAGGPVELTVLVQVMHQRFPAAVDVEPDRLDSEEGARVRDAVPSSEPDPEETLLAAEHDAAVAELADRIDSRLEEWERAVLAARGDSGVLAVRLECGRTKAYGYVNSAYRHLQELAAEEPLGREAVSELIVRYR